MSESVLMTWSGGKDSALALYALQGTPDTHIAALLTTVTEGRERVSMHEVRVALLERQAEALGLPLHKVYIPPMPSNEVYGERMAAALATFQAEGVTTCAFGDLFLEDIRAYREGNLAQVGMKAIFPIWGRDTTALAREFIAQGFKAIVICVDTAQLDPSFIGRMIDADFLDELPPGADPCGENGEYHSFVFDGPNFKEPVACTVGEVTMRDTFCYCDLLPG